MSGISDKATVTLNVNGAQAKQMMADLEKKVKSTEQAIVKLKKANADPKDIEKQRKLLKTYKKQLDEMRSATEGVNRAFKSLDTATPRQLEKTLKTLNKQLKDIQPGTKAWDEHTKKIQQVNAQLKVLKQQIQGQESLWQRFSKWWFQCGQAVAALVMGYQQLISTLRGYVNDFATMEEQMANTLKFTGLSEQGVKELNESFKKLDTRTPREKLNELAQEAGRLGKNTKESVQGYVEAADIINVALVDLGQGATQEIAKLTNIFDVEAAYGTRDAMLKVGSTVNVLSQNCTASKPYIVEFTKRLAGVGAQAKMTIPEIMAFAATLDANGQAVEMSASALSRTIMMLFQKPKEIAKTVGLDVEEFNKTLQRSTTEGLMMFFGALQKMGKKDALAALSPMFKDLGMDGVRMSTVLATIANKLDMVTWEMGEANKAFEEGTSATREYTIFNNTAQAAIDKAKNRIHELSVELGGKLYPLMKYLTSTSSAALKVLNVLVDFLIKYKTTIVSLTISLVAYKIAVNASSLADNVHYYALVAKDKALKLVKVSALLASLAHAKLTGNTTRAAAASRLLAQTSKMAAAALRTIPLLAFATAIGSAFVSIYKMITATDEFKKKMKESVGQISAFNKEAAKEQSELNKLFGALDAAKEGTDEYKNAKDKLISQYGRYLSGLVDEKGKIIDLEGAYRRLGEAIRIANEERGIDNAKKAVEENYYSEIETLTSNLYDTLTKFGATEREATSLVARITTAINMGKEIDANTVARINELSAGSASLGYADWMQTRAANTTGAARYLNQAIADIFTLGNGTAQASPADVVNRMYQVGEMREVALGEVDATARQNRPLRDLQDNMLDSFISFAEQAVENGGGSVMKIADALKGTAEFVEVDLNEAKRLLEEYRTEKAYRIGSTTSPSGGSVAPDPNDGDDDGGGGYTSVKLTEKEAKRKALEEKRALAKANAEYRNRMEGAKGDWEAAKADNVVNYSQGLISYEEYIAEKERIDLKYIEDRINIYNDLYKDESAENKKLLLKYDEDYQELLLKKAEMEKKHADAANKRKVQDSQREYKKEVDAWNLMFSNPDSDWYGDSFAQQEKRHELKIEYLTKYRDAYKENSHEWVQYQQQIEDAEADHILNRRKMYVQELESWRKKYSEQSLEQRKKMELAVVQALLDANLISLEEYKKKVEQITKAFTSAKDNAPKDPDTDPSKKQKSWFELLGVGGDMTSAKRSLEEAKSELARQLSAGEIDHEEYLKKLKQLDDDYLQSLMQKFTQSLDPLGQSALKLAGTFADVFKSISENGKISFENIADIAAATFGTMSAGLAMYGQFAEAQSKIEIANVERKYDREIEAMQGNTYKTAKLEKKKEAEVAKLKAEATKKEFNIKVAQAVANTAQSAILGYMAGLQAGFPMALWLAPTLAGLATATGMVQLALIKKQQKAAEAEGYAEGGFTKPGSKYEPAGIVHAGEWVASQELLANPVARPLIEQLDYVQRTNTIGSLKSEDVSRAITAPQSLSRIMEGDASSALIVAAIAQSSSVVERLADRLDKPIAAITTVAGDHGINQAQDEYDALLRNVTPKSKQK